MDPSCSYTWDQALPSLPLPPTLQRPSSRPMIVCSPIGHRFPPPTTYSTARKASCFHLMVSIGGRSRASAPSTFSTIVRVREEEVRLMLDEIERSSPSPVNLTKAVMELTNNIIGRVALGKTYKLGVSKDVFAEFSELLSSVDIGEYVKWLGLVSKLTGLHGRLAKIARKIDELLETVIEDHVRHRDIDGGRRKEAKEESFVDVLLRVQEEEGSNDSTGSNLDRDSMKAIIYWYIFLYFFPFWEFYT